MRAITAGVLAELGKQKVTPFVACQIQFSDHTLYVWTGFGTLTWNSNDYIGVGNLAGIGVIQETTEVRANGIQLSLSGIPADMISEALSYCRQGLPVQLWLGVLNSSGGVIADPATAFIGRMDTVSIDEGADTATITISVEGRLIDLQRPRIRRYTDDDQQRTSPGDKGFQYVPMVQDWNGPWGLHDRGH